MATAHGVGRITLDRPPLNVLTTQLLQDLAAALRAVAADSSVKVVLLTGSGSRAFCAGVDVADHTPARVASMIAALAQAIDTLLDLELPVIAALNGAALGGGLELALASDIVLARSDAVLGQPEIRLGVFPPAAAALLPRLAGRQCALDLILSGRTLPAEEARALGLVAAVLPAATFETEVEAYVKGLASHSAPVLRLAKRAVVRGLEQSARAALRFADRLYVEELMKLRDPHEGLAAFLEKRQPVWEDR
jgi:cyclohexa-1,5-dienecarbonyl-CoA hydratase